jgi:glycosyltransferase involved in cell wall biosynthesis
MKILFILDEFLPENTGGAPNIAFGLAKSLIKSGHQLMVLTATHNLQKTGELGIEGVKIKVILTKPFGRLRNWKNLKNRNILKQAGDILAQYKPDIVHIHTLHHRFSYGVIGLAKKFSKAVFLTLHDAQVVFNGKLFPKRKICNLIPKDDYRINWLDNVKRDGLTYNPFQRFFIKKALKRADKIFTVSHALEVALKANSISNIEFIHNGIGVGEWMIGEMAQKNILFTGRIDEAKGIKVLAEAFEEVNSQVPDAKLNIVGNSDFNFANKNIKVLPWQNREVMKKIFSEASLVVVPSLYLDPFPTVNLEAMAAAKPVVGTCFGGTPEAIVDNETGYIVNPYNVDDLADKIIDLLKNPEKARAFGLAGYERVKEKFNLETMTKAYLSWYQRMLSNKRIG